MTFITNYDYNLPLGIIKYPNMKKKDPSGVVYVNLINTKFKEYNKQYRRYWLVSGTPYNYLMFMWRELYYDCDFWRFLLEHYRHHIYGVKNYYKIKEQRASNKIKKIMMKKYLI